MVKLTVSLVVPCHRCNAKLRACFESIAMATPQPDEIIVAADGDVDAIALLADEFDYSFANTIPGSGPAAARNTGAKHSTGDLLFFVDSDVTVSPDSIGLIKQKFRQHPETSAMIGSYDDSPQAPNFLSQYKNLFHHYTHQAANDIGDTFWGACGVIRRNIFFSVDGFDERYRRPCVEDIELGYRLRRSGYQIRCCKQLQVKHLKCWRMKSLLKADFFDRALPWTQLMLQDQGCHDNLNISLANRLKVALACTLVVSVASSVLWPQALFLSLLLSIALFVMDTRLFRFFLGRKGSNFALRAMGWQYIYYAYSGLAFAIGLFVHYSQLRDITIPLPKPIVRARNDAIMQ